MITVVSTLMAAAACASGPRVTEGPEPGPTLCADLATLTEAARTNFAGMRREDRPLTVDGSPGFEPTMALANTAVCLIATAEVPYTDTYRCELAPPTTQPAARALVERWASAVAACPAMGTWGARPATRTGRTWELDLGDSHELTINVVTSGDGDTRPVIEVLMNEY